MPELTEQIDERQWEELLHTSPTATPFQSPSFARFLDGLSCVEVFRLGVSESGVLKGVAVAMLQYEGGAVRRHFTRRAIVNGGPLLAGDISDAAASLLMEECAKRLYHKAIYLETRNLHDYNPYRKALQQAGFRYESHYNFQLAVASQPESRYHSNRRHELRNALRQGVQTVWDPPLNQVREMYGLLQRLYTHRVRKPLLPWEFFEAARGMEGVHYLVALTPDGVVAGGMMVVDLDKRSRYVWYECSNEHLRRFKIPTVLYHTAIQQCVELGIGLFDFMGAGRPGDGGYGVRDFKAQFGGTLVEQGRYIHILHPLLYRIGSMAVAVMRNTGTRTRHGK